MSGGHGQAAIVGAVKPRHHAALDLVPLGLDRPAPPRLVVHVAERAAKVLIGEPRFEREEPVDVHRHVLELGKPIEVPGEPPVHVEIEPLRQSKISVCLLPTSNA